VVSERNFTRLNNWLRENGFVVEEIPYAEIETRRIAEIPTCPIRE
jgi:hypothetical protein